MRVRRANRRGSGGIHPPYHKDRTRDLAIRPMPLSKTLRISTSQHLGGPSKPLVKKGDTVVRGQPVAEPSGFVSAWVHAPAAGTVTSVDDAVTVSGRYTPVIEIETTPGDTMHASCTPLPDWQSAPQKAIVEQVAKMGIVGMGGAGFPTHVKLSPPPNKTVDTLILNGAECEPYLTSDHRLMVEQPERIWQGATIIRHALKAARVCVAIEDNKPDAIKAMEKAMTGSDDGVELVILKTEYPQGAEKQLIESVLGREVPSGGLPMDVGALVENVATAAAIRDAVVDGRPLIDRVLTVTGECIASPANLLAPIGTRLADLVENCGGFSAPTGKIISGGPMMGIAVDSLEPGTAKTTSGLLFPSVSSVAFFQSHPCISCGRCVSACPMRLMPCTLSEIVEAENYADAEAWNVLDCIECGSCAFECPAYRPLVHLMKQGKAIVSQRKRQREAAKK